ncbi:Outer membrane protein (porin) [Polaromonas sp. OV174]|uniref:porin n=1 Tax=Polaromonas sp. OV174 TaxID=1855300 RepID=UPI0008DFEA33|nr:porin [Polaromonas sp. OV174]SFC60204.1 Outer membrane protein (porin) [Polaromonas sp. OV174]
MTNQLFSGAIGILLLASSIPPAAAQSTVQVYGRIITSLNHTKTGNGASKIDVEENGSKLGFRGSENLGEGLSTLFGLEMGFDASSGAAISPAYRNSYVGLKGGFGTVALGRLDSGTPVRSPIFSQALSIINLAPNDAGATQIGPNYLNLRNRTSNAIGYASPNLANFVVRARYYLRGQPDNVNLESGGKSLDLGVTYANGPWRTGLSHGRDSRPGGLLPNEFSSKWQTGLRYDIGWVAPYVLVGRDSYANTPASRRNVDYWVLGVKFAHKAHAVVLNVMNRDLQTSLTADRPKQQLAYTYALSKRSELQAFYDHDKVDSSKPGMDKRVFGVGLRHDF